MARTLTEIYTEAKNKRDEYLELNSISNGSKMSILDAFTWVSSACIWSFENIMDVFMVDVASDIQNRINGNAAYYANALLKYQSGDSLSMNDDGTAFSYSTVDEGKRIVTKVSYAEYSEAGFYDKQLLLKIASGKAGSYSRISGDELIAIKSYVDQISFAGQHVNVVSRTGDVLIPRITVYYDGAVSADEAYSNIEAALKNFIAGIEFDGKVYVQKIIDSIQSAEHVVDVFIDPSVSSQGIFVAQYNDDDNLINVAQTGQPANYEQKIDRKFTPNSGYLKQSTKTGVEANLQTWKESITLKVES